MDGKTDLNSSEPFKQNSLNFQDVLKYQQQIGKICIKQNNLKKYGNQVSNRKVSINKVENVMQKVKKVQQKMQNEKDLSSQNNIQQFFEDLKEKGIISQEVMEVNTNPTQSQKVDKTDSVNQVLEMEESQSESIERTPLSQIQIKRKKSVKESIQKERKKIPTQIKEIQQSLKEQFCVDYGAKSIICKISKVNLYINLLTTAMGMKQMIDKTILKPKRLKIAELYLDFIQDNQQQFHFIKLQHIKYEKYVPKNNRLVPNEVAIQNTRKKQTIQCYGDYCSILSKLTLKPEESKKPMIFQELEAQNNTIDLQNTAERNGEELPKYALRVSEGIYMKQTDIEQNCQYKIAKKVIVMDRHNRSLYLRNLLKLQDSQLKEAMQDLQDFLGEERNQMANQNGQLQFNPEIMRKKAFIYKKQIQTNQKSIKEDAIQLSEYVPVCTICFKIYKELEIQAQTVNNPNTEQHVKETQSLPIQKPEENIDNTGCLGIFKQT